MGASITVVWSPCLKHDVDLIEKVQNDFMAWKLKSLSYADRLTKLGWHSLELRRLCFMLQNSFWCHQCEYYWLFFSFSTLSKTRAHAYKLFKTQTTNTVRKKFCTKRVINVWNSTIKTIQTLKRIHFTDFLKCK